MMFAASIGNETAGLFSGMSAVVAVLFVLGLLLIITEYFQSTRGIAYGCGITVLTVAVLMRMLAGGTIGMLFVMLLILAIALLGAHLLMVALYKREWLLLSSGIADEENYADAKYSFLVGLCGVTTTPVAPSGHMSINDINFYVTSDSPIEAGVTVTVRQVSGDKIVVEPLSPEAQEID